MTKRDVPAAELRRLERLRELAAAHRRAERALVRAILAALERGISVRRVAAAIGWPTMNVWRIAPKNQGLAAEDVKLPPRTENGHATGAAKPAPPAKRVAKPKAGGK